MERNKETIQLIYDAIDELNRTLERKDAVDKALDTVLIGESGTLDSMNFVAFAIEVEKAIERTFHKSISLMEIIEITDDAPLTIGRLSSLLGEMLDSPAPSTMFD